MNASYNVENFTENEKLILLRYFTNCDKPVFGLINMPEVVKGALFARYSRSNKSLRRLFLDEFYKETTDDTQENINKDAGLKRAETLFDKVFVEYGDDSVAQLGGAHLACEQASNILAKVLERGRIAAYLEQSTRYVFYNEKINGRYNYITPTEINDYEIEIEYEKCADFLYQTYSEIVNELLPRLKVKFPKSQDQSERAWETTLKAKACDIVRGLLPAGTRTNIGIFASGQAYEMMLIKMFASSNEEVVDYARMMLEELRKIIPSFLKRVDIEERGKLWSKYLSEINEGMEQENISFGKAINIEEGTSSVELVEWQEDAIDKVIAATIYEHSELSDNDLINYAKSLTESEKQRILSVYFGNRKNRRHKPGRALETTYYRFDIVSDYGAFRDLQRHRMLTIQWQKLSPKNGYIIPEELNEYEDLKKLFATALEKAGAFYFKLKEKVNSEIAQYIIPFAYQIRYMFNLNFREAIHLIELRTQKQGHPTYRKVCLDMYSLIKEKAKHGFLLDAIKFVDFSEYNLSREDAEKRVDQKILG